jgi:hypothetical protein
MIIESSNIAMLANSLLVEGGGRSVELRAWVGAEPGRATSAAPEERGGAPLALSGGPLGSGGPNGPGVRVKLSPEAMALLTGLPKPFEAAPEEHEDMEVDPKLYIMKLLVESMTGRKMKLMELKKKHGAHESADDDIEPLHPEGIGEPEGAEWGVEYHSREYRFEREELLFAASGVITTAGGGTIDFNIKIRMERTFYTEEHFDFAAGDAVKIDPLRINFAGSGASLTKEKYAFDIDADGSDESISLPGPGSALLVYDRNGNSRADDGSELFGPSTGNGFKELAAYDADANNWVDESDPVYTRLYVWLNGPDDEAHLIPLKEAGIGAIYLDYADASFSLKDGEDTLSGTVVRSGVYVNDDGRVRTIQQVDLVV